MKKILLTLTLFIGVPICLLALFLGLALRPALVTAQTVPANTETTPSSTTQPTGTALLEVEAGVGIDPCPNTATSLDVRAGDTLYFCYSARNIGDTHFDRHLITDTPVISLPLAFDAPLAAGAAITVERVVTIVATNSFTSSALWQAIASNDLYSVTATGPTIAVNVLPNTIAEQQTLGLEVTVGVDPAVCATANRIVIPADSVAEFCLRVTNTGAEPLERHVITSTATTSGQAPSTQRLMIDTYGLLPGQTVEFTSGLLRQLGLDNSVLAQSFSNSTTVAWGLSSFTKDDQGASVEEFSATDQTSVDVLQAGVTVRKYPSITPDGCAPTVNIIVNSRQEIYYCIVLQNTGQVELTEHSFVDTASGIGGRFRYPLAQGDRLTITQAVLPTIPELTANPLPVLGPFTESITVTHTLTWTSQNDTGYHLSAVLLGTINVPVRPLELTVVRVGDPRTCPGGSSVNAIPIGTRVWYCLQVRNSSSTPITNHSFMQYITPPSQAGARYAYTAGTSFVHTINPGTTLPITTGFLTKTVQRPAVLGPYTIHMPVDGILRYTNTVIYTASNPSLGYQVVASARDVVNLSTATAVATSTFTPIPTNTPFPTEVPSETPTPPPTPTPTMVQISALNLPTPSPSPQFSIANGGVTTPLPGQFNSPLAVPVDPAAAVVVGTPTFTPDIMLLAATQTTDAMATETAMALLLTPTETFTPPPTDTATPPPTYTPTETPSPTPSPSPTSTQRPVGLTSPTAQPGGFELLEGVLTSAAAAAGWIWFIGGSFVFFVTAGIVAGLTLRSSGRSAIPEDDFTTSPAPTRPTRAKSRSQSLAPASDEDDHWPVSLP